jgi:hypothetical protein
MWTIRNVWNNFKQNIRREIPIVLARQRWRVSINIFARWEECLWCRRSSLRDWPIKWVKTKAEKPAVQVSVNAACLGEKSVLLASGKGLKINCTICNEVYKIPMEEFGKYVPAVHSLPLCGSPSQHICSCSTQQSTLRGSPCRHICSCYTQYVTARITQPAHMFLLYTARHCEDHPASTYVPNSPSTGPGWLELWRHKTTLLTPRVQSFTVPLMTSDRLGAPNKVLLSGRAASSLLHSENYSSDSSFTFIMLLASAKVYRSYTMWGHPKTENKGKGLEDHTALSLPWNVQCACEGGEPWRFEELCKVLLVKLIILWELRLTQRRQQRLVSFWTRRPVM